MKKPSKRQNGGAESSRVPASKNSVRELFGLLAIGPRNLTAYQLATMIRDKKFEEARSLYSWDGDKIASTIYQAEISKHLGCRLHGEHNCDGPFCK